MAKKLAPPTANDRATLPGDYYGTHDACLYRVSYANCKLWQARCTRPAATAAADVFGEPYETSAAQLRRLLAFNCFTRAL